MATRDGGIVGFYVFLLLGGGGGGVGGRDV